MVGVPDEELGQKIAAIVVLHVRAYSPPTTCFLFLFLFLLFCILA